MPMDPDFEEGRSESPDIDLDNIYQEWAQATQSWEGRRSLREALVVLGAVAAAHGWHPAWRSGDRRQVHMLLAVSWGMAALAAWNHL